MSAIVFLSQALGVDKPSALAKAIGARQQEVWNWANGRRIPADRCVELERRFHPRVSVDDLRPDIPWERVADPGWPHPGGRPCLDIAAMV